MMKGFFIFAVSFCVAKREMAVESVSVSSFGAKKPVPGLTGQCLHATGLRFVHPRTGEPVELHCPLPPEFTAMLQKLQSKAQ